MDIVMLLRKQDVKVMGIFLQEEIMVVIQDVEVDGVV